jgi:hypothetical protein
VVRRKLALAEVRLLAEAEVAAPARADQADDDSVAGRDPAHTRPELLDHPGGLVPVHRGQLASPRALGERDVAVADRGHRDPHPHLARPGSIELELLDDERRAKGAANRGLHGGGKRDARSRSATSIVFRVYWLDADRAGWKSHG